MAKSKLKIILAILGGLALLGIIAIVAFILLARSFVKELKEQKPATVSDIEQAANVLKHPELAAELKGGDAQGVMGGLANKAKGKFVEEAVKKGLEEMRKNIDKASSNEGERSERVAELAKAIEGFKIDEQTYKMLSKDMINEGIKTYLRETTPEERVLYDPLLQSALEKLASYGRERERQGR